MCELKNRELGTNIAGSTNTTQEGFEILTGCDKSDENKEDRSTSWRKAGAMSPEESG